MRDPLEEQKEQNAIDDLRDGGTLSRSLPGYQERGAQKELAERYHLVLPN